MSAIFIFTEKLTKSQLNRRYNDRTERKEKLRTHICG